MRSFADTKKHLMIEMHESFLMIINFNIPK